MKALIFDFDGTILDTEAALFAAWQHVYTEHQCALPLEFWQKRIGTDPANFDPLQYLENQAGVPLNHGQVTLSRRNKLADLLLDLKPLSGVHEWILSARKAGMHLAVASGSPRNWVIDHLNKIDFLKYFDVIVTQEDVRKPKPDPEIYNNVLEKLGVSSWEAIAIEDSPSGATAALAAGIHCIAVPNRLTVDMMFPKDSLIVCGLKELSLLQLLKTIN
jgi:putative hydrolase of the HAD superfamily